MTSPIPYQKDEYECNLMLIGDSGVGKTCLIQRFIDDLFIVEMIHTIGNEMKMRSVNVDGKYVKVIFWDTAGQERFRSVTQNFYRKKKGIAMVYDITNMTSFNHCADWLKEIKTYADDDAELMLIGNKTDMEKRRVPKEKGKMFANENRMIFCETSAKDRDNVNQAFLSLLHKIDKKRKRYLETTIIEENQRQESESGESVNAQGEQNDTIDLSNTNSNRNKPNTSSNCC